ncbi:MAG: SDR family NAD(P)-dependent oxidoreductase [Candidatus Aenigmarchaeota archaeon]|nr:SDR family NAD(P)-dependent oxidoreductase [Candidatus Aenigmarchaeota archaeon]
MKMLVTGGAGFIGSNLTEILVENGHEVVVLDNLFLGKKENLSSAVDSIEFVEGDVCDRQLVFEIMKDVDYVFHQAAASSSPMFAKDLRGAVAVNVDGLINVLEAAKMYGVKRVVHACTSSIYGNNPVPHSEDMHVEPPNAYAASKFAAEHIGRIYSAENGLETVGLRYFSVYGPHEKAKGKFANTVSQFMWDMKDGRTPVIFGDGSQTRDFTFVRDVAAANILAAKRPGISGQIFNVGTGVSKSFNDIIDMLNAGLGTSITPKYVNNPIKNYVKDTLADTRKAEKMLGFRARISLEEGIKEIVSLEESRM